MGVHLLTGPDGIGKTTLLNVIAGSLPLAAGRLLFCRARLLDHRDARVVLAPNAPPDMPWIRSGLLLDFITSLYPATPAGQGLRRPGEAGVWDSVTFSMPRWERYERERHASCCWRPRSLAAPPVHAVR